VPEMVEVKPCLECRSREVCRFYAFLLECFEDAVRRASYRGGELESFPEKFSVALELERCRFFEK